MLAESLIVLDFETTGLRSDLGDRVTEIAALRVRGNQIVDRFETLVNCEMRVPAYITGYTGISQSMVDSAPAATEAFRGLLTFIGNDFVVAHNAEFDQGFLDVECRRLGLAHGVSEFICSVRLARRVFPLLKSHALGSLSQWLGFPFTPGAHRAGVDAAVTVSVLLKLCETIRARYRITKITPTMLQHLARLDVEIAIPTAA